MPRKTSNSAISDISKMVIESHERLDALEKKGGIDHERISVLEHHAQSMSGLPATVAALGQEVKSLDTSMKREVDGLREQQKAHAEKMDKGFILIGGKVDAIVTTNNKFKNWWELLRELGAIIVGLALIIEAARAFIH